MAGAPIVETSIDTVFAVSFGGKKPVGRPVTGIRIRRDGVGAFMALVGVGS